MFEGLALGTRIAALPADSSSTSISWLSKFIMASLFAVITPIGMGIGTGVLHSFNGNDPKTIVAIGTLDALSAGILIWVGIVGMWAHDWMGGSMKDVSLVRVCVGITSLVFGMVSLSSLVFFSLCSFSLGVAPNSRQVIMSVLGKWA
jgi:zinc transporter 1/2/3